MLNVPRGIPAWIGLGVAATTFGVAMWASLAAYSQGTLPLPAPGTTPPANTAPLPPAAPGAPEPGTQTPAPATPAAPPAGDNAARARAAALAAKANIDITDAWARATPGNATTAAIYLHLVSAKDPDRLLSVDSAYAQKTEVHDEMTQNGVMKMSAVTTVDIPAGGTVNFTPGGRHLMLTGLKGPLKEGDSFLVTFTFDKAGTQSAVVKVVGAAANGPPPTTNARRGDTTAGVSAR